MKTLSATGAWETTVLEYIGTGLGFVVGVLDRNQYWLVPLIMMVFACAASYSLYWAAMKTYHGARSAWYYLRQVGRRAYHRVRKQKTMRRMGDMVMAKWKQSVLADKYFDFLLQLEMDGFIDRNDRKKMMVDFGKKYHIIDLIPHRWHQSAIRHWLIDQKAERELAGPKGTIPGGPPALYVPAVENVVPASKFLQKLQEKKAA